jgi:tRNA pseudouridine(55) synthase
MPILFYKKVGETPLEALNRLRLENPTLKNERLSYAGRLDPMAEGLLLVLVGNECNEDRRRSFLGLEKEYEVQVLFGFSTDSFDLLGIPKMTDRANDDLKFLIEKILPEYIGGSHGLKYPPFSSKTIKGVPLFELAKSTDGAPNNLPDIKGQIKGLKIIEVTSINPQDLKEHVHKMVGLVNGDFRQKEILNVWDEIIKTAPEETAFPLFKLLIHCESGVYMRSLADSLGSRVNLRALAFSIKRTRIGDYTDENMA